MKRFGILLAILLLTATFGVALAGSTTIYFSEDCEGLSDDSYEVGRIELTNNDPVAWQADVWWYVDGSPDREQYLVYPNSSKKVSYRTGHGEDLEKAIASHEPPFVEAEFAGNWCVDPLF